MTHRRSVCFLCVCCAVASALVLAGAPQITRAGDTCPSELVEIGHWDQGSSYSDIWAEGDIVYQGTYFNNKVHFFDISNPANIVVLTAAQADQVTGTIDEQGHGAFTYFFLKGLNGAAVNAAGAVTLSSLYNYLSPKVANAASRQNRDQTPVIMPASFNKAGTSGVRLR